MKSILDKYLKKHPNITAYDGVVGGQPHIKGRRITVRHVLTKLHATGSVQAVADDYDLTDKQVKEALAFARDFTEEVFRQILKD